MLECHFCCAVRNAKYAAAFGRLRFSLEKAAFAARSRGTNGSQSTAKKRPAPC
jgi:hypothetical protein